MRAVFVLFAVVSSFVAGAQDHMGLFWKVTGNGLEKPSYLYGTMHTSDERVFHFPESTEKALESVDIVALELKMDSINKMELMPLLMMPNGMTLDSLLSKEDFELANKYYSDSLGMPLAMFNSFMPMYTASMMQMKDLSSDRAEALDLYFAKRGNELNKRVIGLEKVKEQVSAFGAIPLDKQAEGLVEAVELAYSDDPDASVAGSDSLMIKYLSGDLDGMVAMTNEYESDDPELQEIFTRVFLVERNHRMVERAVKRMEKNSLFIAVGAAHLGGDQGLIELFRERGYTVEAVIE